MFPTVHGIVSQRGIWWKAGGATGAVAVYQPKGAASLAASYVDLSESGNTAAPGVAPTLTASGWTFDGLSTYLILPFVPPANQTWSAIVRYSGSVAKDRYLFNVSALSGESGFGISPNVADTFARYWNGYYKDSAPILPSGVLGFAGNVGYRNGVAEIGTISTSVRTLTNLRIGCGFVVPPSIPDKFFDGSIQALAIYNNVLSAPQMLAISRAMAAL